MMAGHKRISLLTLMCLFMAACTSRPSTDPASPQPVQLEATLHEQLSLLLDSYGPIGGVALPEETVVAAYQSRDYVPIWLNDGGTVSPAAQGLLDTLQQAHDHGLNPTHYHTQALESYLALPRPTVSQLAEFDVIATIALERYAHDVSSGRYDPATIDSNWQLDAPNDRWQALLTLDDPQDMVAGLPGLAPQHPHYRNLQRWMAYYQELDRTVDDVRVPRGELLMRGATDQRVATLRQRLQQLGDLRAGARGADPNRFDHELETAVKRFQSRHQLGADGRVGSQTIAAMNVPIGERARQIRWNLERWRWLPAELEDDRIWVDLTAYQVEMHLNGAIHSMRSVIGQPDRMTRVFRGEMTYMEINPTWRVPQRLAREMILPLVQQDPGYLARNQYEVYSGWHTGAEQLDPDRIDWQAIAPDDLYYRFEQLPDPGNAMGQYKFMFPNRNAIYLHDTPEQQYFGDRYRARSAGCVRLENPSFFADALLAGNAASQSTLNRARASDETTVITLDQPVPIYLVYFTVMLDEHGLPEFRNDVYERDPLMSNAMDTRPF